MTTDIPQSNDPFRPAEWTDFIGQHTMMTQLAIYIDAAVRQERAVDHILLSGPPGFGKTSLVNLIAGRSGDPMVSVKMPLKADAMYMLFKRFSGGILFLDELQGATKGMQEDLLTVLEDGYFSTNGIRIPLPFITVIGATTEKQAIIKPLLDRFTHQPFFESYTDEEMGALVKSMGLKAGLVLDDTTAVALGKATGGTPRNAKRLILTARDLLEMQGKMPSSTEILAFCRTDADGLTQEHLAYLKALAKSGDVAGLTKISRQLGLHEGVLLDLERLLVEKDLLGYSARGRELTPTGYAKAAGVPLERQNLRVKV